MSRRHLRRVLRSAACLALFLSAICEPARYAEAGAIPAATALSGATPATTPFSGTPGAVSAEIVAKFLEGQAGSPVWTEPGGAASLNAHGKAVVEALQRAGREGLRPDDYRLPETSDGVTLETAVTSVVLRYVTDLQAGRIDPKRADPELFVYAREVDGVAMLERVAGATDPARALADLAPANPVYRRLRRLLAEYRDIEQAGGWGTIADGEPLKPGHRDVRIAEIRRRLAVSGDATVASEDPDAYDEVFGIAIRSFQARHGLEPDGVVGNKTILALNAPVADRIRQIVINMERFRWMPDDLGDDHVFVNMAGFTLDYVRHGSLDFTMRVVVGRPFRETPIFSDRIRYLEFNPTWTVPPKIASNDLLPKILKDPGFLAAGGYEVYAGWDDGAARLDPMAVDWARYKGRNLPFRLRQAPGKKNALGRVKFMFPNDFDIYLHDTPAREHFRRAVRNFSSGCIRLEHPVTLAERLFEADGQDASRIGAILESGKTARINLATPVPVHLTYLTAWIGEGGTVEFRDDLYGRDVRLAAALGL